MKRLTTDQLIEGVLAGNRLALARAISRVEDEGKDAPSILRQLFPHTGNAHLIGVTGAPGTGKSTLVTALVQSYRATGQTVAVLAVDPTSPFSGGALLGDRVRMTKLSGDPGVFIRSMATRGSLGGLAKTTGDVLLLLDAAGFGRILIETVGVGQAEVEIASTAHTTVVVEAPGLGDEVQAIKAGILEIADIFVVNKADRNGVERTVTALEMMLHMNSGVPQPVYHHGRLLPVTAPQPEGAETERWPIRVLKTVAVGGRGVEELRQEIERHRTWLHETSAIDLREQMRTAHILETLVQAALTERLRAALSAEALAALVEEVRRRRTDPYTAARRLLDELT